MEALTAVAVAGLAVIDMVKGVDPAATHHRRRGHREDRRRSRRLAPIVMTRSAALAAGCAGAGDHGVGPVARRRRALTPPGPLLSDLLTAQGFSVAEVVVVPDEVEDIEIALRAAISDGVDLVATTGGTGFSPRDVTPEATRRVIDREAPGLGRGIAAISTRRAAHHDPVARRRRDGRIDIRRQPARFERRGARWCGRACTCHRPRDRAAARWRPLTIAAAVNAPGWPAVLRDGDDHAASAADARRARRGSSRGDATSSGFARGRRPRRAVRAPSAPRPRSSPR